MIYPITSHYDIGDIVTINVYGKEYSYELLAKDKKNNNTNIKRIGSNYTMYIPKNTYLQAVSRPIVMSYDFNVKNGKELAMDGFLQGTQKIQKY